MFWRTKALSLVVVAAVALTLALSADGVFGARCFDCFRDCGSWVKETLCGIGASVDGLVAAEPARLCAGPAYVLVAWGGEVLGLDREGVVASSDTACARADLPALTGFVPAVKTVGERISSAEIVLGLEIIRAFDERPELMKVLSEINLADLTNPKAVLLGGVSVNLGQGDYRSKMENLIQVLLHLKRLNASPRTIDLRFSRQVVVKCSEPKRNLEKEV
ncbi:MAG: cell division protein FtsQ/DivIB [bacterium]